MAALHSADTQSRLYAGAQVFDGRTGVRERFAALFDQWRNFHFAVYDVQFGDCHWVVDWDVTSAGVEPSDRRDPIGSTVSTG